MARKFVLPQRPSQNASVDFQADLNDQQLAAVTSGEGPKLVIAGAGTGKTRTLTYRVAWLLEQGLRPDGVLVVTFTNKAAREMMGRVERLTSIEASRLWGGTFHSTGARVLRHHAHLLGYSDSFSILDDADQRELLRLCITDIGIEVERKRFPSPKVLGSLLSLHANTETPLSDLLEDRYSRFSDWGDEVTQVGARYVERKRAANVMDYDDLLHLWLRLFQEHPDVRRRYARQWRYVLVDEYQDTNRVQGAIVESIAADNGRNFMVVGDDSQSIYAFRGAHYDNILAFPERNEGTEVFKLETNYRSTPQILAVANACIGHNVSQYPKSLSAQCSDGAVPALVPCNYPDQEATFVAERILQLRDEDIALADIAVLYRAHTHRLSIEATFLRYDIPYEVRGGLRFFEQAHIKDVAAYLRVCANPHDEVAFRRAALLHRGIGNVTASRLWDVVRSAHDIDELVVRLRSPEAFAALQRRGKQGGNELATILTAVAAQRDDPEQAIRAILEDGYRELAAAQFTNFDARVEDIEQLAIFAAQYATVQELLEELVLLGEMYGQDVDSGTDAQDERGVVLSTIHQAKGLEWDAVFLVHLVEGATPSPRGLEEPGGEEEERRIFYVALTRARRELYLSYPMIRPTGSAGSMIQQPSRFLDEIPNEIVELWQLFEEAAPVPERGAPFAGHSGTSNEEFDPNVDPVWDDEAFFD